MLQPFKFITVRMKHTMLMPRNPLTRVQESGVYAPIYLDSTTGEGIVPGMDNGTEVEVDSQIIGVAMEAFAPVGAQTKVCVQGIVNMRIGATVKPGDTVRIQSGSSPLIIPDTDGKRKWVVGIAMTGATFTSGKIDWVDVLLK